MARVSVVMATYNGRLFLEEQMDSIRLQSMPADEILICDDASTDGTQEFVRDYIASYKLNTWYLKEHACNQGYVKTFLNLALEAKGNIVFFSDQDDIWLKDKIAHTSATFAEHADCLAVLCSERIINSTGAKVETIQTKIQQRYSLHPGKVSLDAQVSSMVASGHLLAVKKSFLEEVVPLITAWGTTYDTPIGLLAAAHKGLYKTGTIDVLHRVHTANSTTSAYGFMQRMTHRTRHIDGRAQQLELLECCREQVVESADVETLAVYDGEIAARKQSLAALEERHIGPLLKSLFRRSAMKNEALEIANVLVTLVGRG